MLDAGLSWDAASSIKVWSGYTPIHHTLTLFHFIKGILLPAMALDMELDINHEVQSHPKNLITC